MRGRGRPSSRGSSVGSPRRVGRPPKTDRSAMSNGRSVYNRFIPSGVIRSNFPRRQTGIRRTNIVSRIRGRGRPGRMESMIQAQYIFDKSPEKTQKTLDGELAIEDDVNQPSTSGTSRHHTRGSVLNGSASRNETPNVASTSSSVVPGIYEDVNLVTVIEAAAGPSSSIKDVVCTANFKKLSFEAQQYLLKLLPQGDTIRRPDWTLEPTFSALKNEYLSAALLDFQDRLYAGEIPTYGEIPALRSSSPPSISKSRSSSGQERAGSRLRSPQSSSNSQAPPVQMSPSSPSHPPLPKLRINVAAGIITIIPQENKQNGWSVPEAVTIDNKEINGEDHGSNGSTPSSDAGKSNTHETEIDFTPYFVAKAARNAYRSERSSFRGRPPANQKGIQKKRR